MNAYRYGISLRIKHPSLDPNEITSVLAMKPWRSWRAGEPRTTPKGTPLEGNNRETYWTSGDVAKGNWPKADLASAINDTLDKLETHRDLFYRVRAGGGKTELFIGWYFLGNSGDVFDCELLARMADLKIDLSLDVYPPGQPQSDI